MEVYDVRKLFPHIEDDIIYFNHASVGPLSKKVIETIDNYILQRSRRKINNYDDFLEISERAKDRLSKMLNCTPDRIAWTDNVSNGISNMVQGIEWNEGDRIIISDNEFPANVYPFLNLKMYGVEVDIVKSNNGIITIEDFKKLITNKTKLISVSLVQFLSGYKINLKEFGNLCREHNIIFCVDAIQGAGIVKINVIDSNVDFLISGSHKWLMSLQGASFFYISEKLQNRIKQKNVGWLSVKNAWDFLNYDLTLLDTAERYQSGTPNAMGIFALESSLEMFQDFGYERVASNVISNTEYFFNKLIDIGLNPFLNGVDSTNLAGTVSIKHDKSKRFLVKLESKKIFTAMREGILRISPHFYNTEDEIDFVIEELKRLV